MGQWRVQDTTPPYFCQLFSNNGKREEFGNSRREAAAIEDAGMRESCSGLEVRSDPKHVLLTFSRNSRATPAKPQYLIYLSTLRRLQKFAEDTRNLVTRPERPAKPISILLDKPLQDPISITFAANVRVVSRKSREANFQRRHPEGAAVEIRVGSLAVRGIEIKRAVLRREAARTYPTGSRQPPKRPRRARAGTMGIRGVNARPGGLVAVGGGNLPGTRRRVPDTAGTPCVYSVPVTPPNSAVSRLGSPSPWILESWIHPHCDAVLLEACFVRNGTTDAWNCEIRDGNFVGIFGAIL
ncbi:hypothetical protein KM043_009237 [Ampulex compressa]|nr:hypothetical protein KM043_009237 [Ampulex compressa]